MRYNVCLHAIWITMAACDSGQPSLNNNGRSGDNAISAAHETVDVAEEEESSSEADSEESDPEFEDSGEPSIDDGESSGP